MNGSNTPSPPGRFRRALGRVVGSSTSSDNRASDASNAAWLSTDSPGAHRPGIRNSHGHRTQHSAVNLLPDFNFSQRPLSEELSQDDGPAEHDGNDFMEASKYIAGTGNITYLPGQVDRQADISASANFNSPIFALARDAWVFARMLPYIPQIFFPLSTNEPTHEFYPSSRNVMAKVAIALASIIEVVLLLAFPIFLFLPLPPLLLIAGVLAISGFIWLLMWHTQGADVIMSRMDIVQDPDSGQTADLRPIGPGHFKNERWLFLNGIMTGGIDLQKNIDAIARVFGRPVLGIHNKTYGFLADVIECAIQRCLSYPTRDGRIAYEAVKASILDPEVHRIVLIAHSQGGIEASLVLDRLLTELPQDLVSKLEIYTFGSAASHFNNPIVSWLKPAFNFKPGSAETNLTPLPTKLAIKHIEHYANEYDMVPRWGVLYSVYKIISRHYSGQVFVRLGASGHFFNQHYLSAMFPLDAQAASDFLDQEVQAETDLAHKREAMARRQTTHMRSRSTVKSDASSLEGLRSLWFRRWGIEFGDGDCVKMPIGRLGPGEIAFLTGHAEAEAAKGKTIRELSRLWKYVNGGVPED